MGVRPKKNFLPRKLRKTIPGSVVTFLPNCCLTCLTVALGPTKGPAGLVACLLLDAQAPLWFPNDLISRLKYSVPQLGDPNPNRAIICLGCLGLRGMVVGPHPILHPNGHSV